ISSPQHEKNRLSRLTFPVAGCTVNDILNLTQMTARNSVRRRKPSWRSAIPSLPVAFLRVLAILLVFLTAQPGPAQLIDLNSNGMSDVWEQIYGAGGLAPNADADGDGVSNLKEALDR